MTHWESMYCTEYCLLCSSSKLLIQQRGIYGPNTANQGWKGLKGWDPCRIWQCMCTGMQDWLEQPRATEPHTWSRATSGIARSWETLASKCLVVLKWDENIQFWKKMQAKWFLIFSTSDKISLQFSGSVLIFLTISVAYYSITKKSTHVKTATVW